MICEQIIYSMAHLTSYNHLIWQYNKNAFNIDRPLKNGQRVYLIIFSKIVNFIIIIIINNNKWITYIVTFYYIYYHIN
jgi:hypothetical protein